MANPRKRRARKRVRREKLIENWGLNKAETPAAPEKKAAPAAPKKKAKAAKAKPKGE